MEAILATYGVDVSEPLSNIQLYSMACVALPTCGLAVAESERALPALVDEIEQAAARFGVQRTGLPLRNRGAQVAPAKLQLVVEGQFDRVALVFPLE